MDYLPRPPLGPLTFFYCAIFSANAFMIASIIESSKDEDTGEEFPAVMHFDVYDKYGDTESWDELDIEEDPTPKNY